MKLQELKAKIEAERIRLRENAGHICNSSEHGPIRIDLIESIYAVLQDQQKQIDKLVAKVGA